jgi:hypothetical protein
MSTEYEVWIRDKTGTRRRVIPGRAFMRVEYVKQINNAGLLLFDLPSHHPAVADLEYDGIVEVRRRNVAAGIAWYTDFGGLYVDFERWTDQDRTSRFRAYCPGYLDLLGGEIVAWPANTANKTYFAAQPAETVVKALVNHNAVAANATTGNGRYYTTDVAGVTVQTDGAGGNDITREFAGQNLLAALQDVAEIGGGDFDLIRGSGAGWEFRWYQAQRGTDRTATLVFALQYKNMELPRLLGNRLAERTRVVVVGQGAEGARPYRVRTGENYSLTGRNRNVFTSVSETSNAALDAAGDLRMEELRAKTDLQFRARDTAVRKYGRDFFLGDLGTAYYEGVTGTKQIVEVAVVVEPHATQPEKIDIKVEDA